MAIIDRSSSTERGPRLLLLRTCHAIADGDVKVMSSADAACRQERREKSGGEAYLKVDKTKGGLCMGPAHESNEAKALQAACPHPRRPLLSPHVSRNAGPVPLPITRNHAPNSRTIMGKHHFCTSERTR